MKTSLGTFQDAFVEALYRRPAPALQGVTTQAAFEVYRNTVLKGCVDALCDNFPTVERLVGTDWIRAAAAVHAREAPPDDARLVLYGKSFADFLDAFEPARELPYLGAVARLDRLWTEAFVAPQEARLDLASLAGMTASDLATCHLAPRACVRWSWFPEQPVYSIWRYNREAVPIPEELPWQGEGALLVGHADGVAWHALEAGGCDFLDACANGSDLDQASALTLQAHPDLDFHDLFGRLLGAGVFRPINLA
ncbi:putative DNA-binding domain-containing protein [Pseudomonas sp. BGr12]|uniref:HvfC/BufC family peptide modification chaperone n=1 Tax=unclassified Pseudomonas TaxID=196821 RepID=UPI00177BD006|nr:MULTISPECIES: putative DNA-binding domain-containing protein [unclassified Pseudomonas]MBD9500623.1 putative DNA-binding domain-containing protein [Pseudomonas sp. PDM17]MDL2430801.1 DNA-binding domain-containing protein [Pseudomonas sp. BJa5]